MNKDSAEDLIMELIQRHLEEKSPREISHIPSDLRQNISEGEIALQSSFLVIPIRERPPFPGMIVPLTIDSKLYSQLIRNEMAENRTQFVLSLTLQEDFKPEQLVTKDDIHKIGTVVETLKIKEVENERIEITLQVLSRVKIEKTKQKEPYSVKIKVLEDTNAPSPLEARAILLKLKEYIEDLTTNYSSVFKEELTSLLKQFETKKLSRMTDFAAAMTTVKRDFLQTMLEELNIRTRVKYACKAILEEIEICKVQDELHESIEENMNKHQKEFILREHLNTIKKELGIDKEDKETDAEKFKKRLDGKNIPEEVAKTLKEELDKFRALEVQSGEYGICRNYLDWLTQIPWGIQTEDNTSIKKASEVLEAEHHGLKDIKERILEFLGIAKLAKNTKSTILCLVGPPGVGKTSIGKSVAKALGRKFYRFSVGGMRDEAEIKGHRRTYIGAMPGKIIQALKQTQVMNPVILLDEVDKMGSSRHGDPGAALLEVLDPEQNNSFVDHYLDVPCDLSQVLFIITANLLEDIPDALRDRMEVLRLSGYILEEKLEIAEKYLLPRNIKEMGLDEMGITFPKETLNKIIHGYAREAGVRSLENHIKKILRKIGLKYLKHEEELQESGKKEKKKGKADNQIKKNQIEEFLGKPQFTSEKFYDVLPPGVCTGLAWTSMGGATLYIETLAYPAEKIEMKLTGQAGDVMKESAEIAWSYLQANYHKFTKREDFFKGQKVHIHIPEGATPKDGPSAGVTMVSALLSLLRGEAISTNLAMTGELTLTGKVLPIGGVKEKVIAARRVDISTILLPKENQRDYDELPDYVKEGIAVKFIEKYEDVFHYLFGKK